MRIKTTQWMRRHRIPNLDRVEFAMAPITANDERDPNNPEPLLFPVHLKCDCCGTHARFSDDNPYEGSGWTRSDHNPNRAYNGSWDGAEELFEVDLCDKCSKEHDVAEFDSLPRTGCQWCWKRFSKTELTTVPGGGQYAERVCRECAAKVKRCSKCEQLHSKEDFAKDTKSRDGLDYTCKYCRADARKSSDARRRDAARKRAERRAS